MSKSSPIQFRLAGDRTPTQYHFFESLNKEAPEVLQNLYETVFPAFLEAVGKTSDSIDKACRTPPPSEIDAVYEALKDHERNHARLIGKVDKGYTSESTLHKQQHDPSFIGELTDYIREHNRLLSEAIETWKDDDVQRVRSRATGIWFSHDFLDSWRAFWDWAARYHLSPGMDIDYLKTQNGLGLAEWYHERQWQRKTLKFVPATFGARFRMDRSTEVTFGMPLAEVVWFTLLKWSDFWDVLGSVPENNLYWRHYPRPHPFSGRLNLLQLMANPIENPICGNMDVDHWKAILSNPVCHPTSFFHPPFTYQFEAIAWDIYSGQTRAEAKEAILRELEKQVDVHLENHVQRVKNKPYLKKPDEKREIAHFDYLVLYQIKGMSYSGVANYTFGKKKENENDRGTVTNGIKTTAVRLIGPRFETWLRPSKPGRPRSSKS